MNISSFKEILILILYLVGLSFLYIICTFVAPWRVPTYIHTYLYIFIYVQDEEITASHEDTLLLLLLSLLHPDLPHLVKETYQPKIKGRYHRYPFPIFIFLYLHLSVSLSSLYLCLFNSASSTFCIQI